MTGAVGADVAGTVRLITLNVLARSHADGPERERVLRRALCRLRPDVVALQEITRDGDVDQAAALLGAEYTVVDHPGFSPDGVGVRYDDAWEAVHPDEPGHTVSPSNPLVRVGQMPLERGRRVDHVMVRSGPHGPLLEVADCRLVLDAPVEGVWASDHAVVLADLRLPDHRPGAWGAVTTAR